MKTPTITSPTKRIFVPATSKGSFEERAPLGMSYSVGDELGCAEGKGVGFADGSNVGTEVVGIDVGEDVG